MAEEKKEEIVEEDIPVPEEDDAGMPGCPFWMLTFGDVVSLLMTFFVLILSFSDLDPAADKLSKINFYHGGGGNSDIKAVGGSAAGGAIDMSDVSGNNSGNGEGGSGGMQEVKKEINAKALKMSENNQDTIHYSVNEVNEFLSSSDEELQEGVEVKETSGGGGFKLSIDQDFAFSMGTARFRASNKDHLNKIASFLAELPNDIIISTMSDDYNKIAYPLYPSNMYLSIARSSAIAKFLHEAWDIPMERIAVKVMDDKKKESSYILNSTVKQKVVIEVISEFNGFLRSEMKEYES